MEQKMSSGAVRESVSDLLHRMNVTKGCRFNAAKRLDGRERKMTLIVALASALVIALTFIPFAYRLPPLIVSDLSVVTVIASVIILAVSLIQYSNNDAVNAEQHHRCGLEVNELRAQLNAKVESLSEAELVTFTDRYARILDKYSINHDGIDFDQYRIEHPEVYNLTSIQKMGIYSRRLVNAQWSNALMVAIVVFFFYLVLVHVVPARLNVIPNPPQTERHN